MKRALCINSIEDLQNLISDKSKTITTSLIDRAICENPDNKFLQIIPYVTFYMSQHKDGKITFIQYVRASSGGDERLRAKASIGFGGHIDQITDIKSTISTIKKDGTEQFIMTRKDFFASIINAAERELLEELSFNVFKLLNVNVNINETFFITPSQDQEVNKVHIGLSIPIKLTEEKLSEFFKNAQINTAEIENIDKVTISTRDIVEEMDLTLSISKMFNMLDEKYDLENWSKCVYETVIRKEIADLLKNVYYDDLYKLAVEKQAN